MKKAVLIFFLSLMFLAPASMAAEKMNTKLLTVKGHGEDKGHFITSSNGEVSAPFAKKKATKLALKAAGLDARKQCEEDLGGKIEKTLAMELIESKQFEDIKGFNCSFNRFNNMEVCDISYTIKCSFPDKKDKVEATPAVATNERKNIIVDGRVYELNERGNYVQIGVVEPGFSPEFVGPPGSAANAASAE